MKIQKVFTEQHFKRQIFFLWIILSCLIIFAQWREISVFQMGDADDHLRIAQVRDWLAGQSWFDITQYRINPPDGGQMHWSRLVDVPIAAMILILRPVFGPILAEQMAAAIIPLLTFGIVLWLMASITKRLFGHKAALLAAAATFTVLPVVNQLLPMRIDHHGWQLVLFLTCLFALMEKKRPLRAVIILAFAAALWLEISIEGLPFLITFLGLLALRWIVPQPDSEETKLQLQFPIAMLAITVSTAALFLMTEGRYFAESFCDALSLVHIATLGIIALVVNVAVWGSRLAGVKLSFATKLIVSIVAAAAGIGCVINIAPQCAGDAFNNLDPVVREYWFDRVLEGLPIWDVGFRYWIQPLLGFFTGILGFIYLFRWNKAVATTDKITLGLLFLASMFVGLYVLRVSVYALCIANIIVAPFVLKIFRISDQQSRLFPRMGLRIIAVMLMAPTLVGSMVYQVFAKPDATIALDGRGKNQQRFERAYECHARPAIAALDAMTPARIMTGLDVSPSILHNTRLKIVATGHHRNQLAMKDVIETMTGTPEAARAIMEKRKIQYLIGCDGSPELNYYRAKAPNGLWSKLQAGESYDWLESKPMIGPYHVWRIRPSAE